MDKLELKRIVSSVSKECSKNFDKHKQEDYTLAGLTVIPFVSKTVSTKSIGNWGTDEDRDEYIWYSSDGWQHADMTVQVGAGVNRVVENYMNSISEDIVVETLLKWNLNCQMEFMHRAYLILQFSEFKCELY